MSISQELFKTTPNDVKEKAVAKLIDHSFPSIDFYLMVLLSVAMASFGLIINSTAVIIGSMLIAPVLHPILSFAMGFVVFNDSLTYQSLGTLFKSVLLSLATAFVVGALFATKAGVQDTFEIMSRVTIEASHVFVAVIAGFASAFALVKSKLTETIPGIAISVSLVPPLAVAGIGLSVFDMAVFRGALSLFVINVIGVIVASSLVFSLMNFYSVRQGAAKALITEEQEAAVRKKAMEQAKEKGKTEIDVTAVEKKKDEEKDEK